MSDIKKITITAFLGLMALELNMPLSVHSQSNMLLSQCQKVNYPVGLIVRSAPSSSSRRVGSIIYGQRVKLDGIVNKNSRKVIPTTVQDKDGNTWVKILAPRRGFILFTTGTDRDSLISCQQ